MTKTELIAWLGSTSTIKMVLVEVSDIGNAPNSTVYLSSKPYVTAQGETPELVSYDPCITSGLTFSESISLDGTPSIGYGDIQIDNTDGSRDSWLYWVWANRSIKIYIGDPQWPRVDFFKIFDGQVADISASSRETLNLMLLNKLDRLNNPISEKTLGSLYPNDSNKPVGAIQNRDAILPLCFGECFNITPLLISSALGTGTTNELIYMVNDGPIDGIIEIRDNGVPLTPGVGYTVNLAQGTFTLLRAPAGVITCSVRGSTLGGTYSNKIVDIIKYIVITYGPVDTRFNLTDLNTVKLDAFSAPNQQAVGIYLSDRANVLEVCQDLASSIGASVSCSHDGLLHLIKLQIPGDTVVDMPTVIDENNTQFESLSLVEKIAVRGTSKIGYCKNWTIQESGLAGAVPQSSCDLFKDEWLYATSTDSITTSLYRLGGMPTEETTLLIEKVDAETEANRRLELWKTPRFIFTMNTLNSHVLLEIGSAVTVHNYRYALTGKTGTVISIDKNWFTGETTLGVLV